MSEFPEGNGNAKTGDRASVVAQPEAFARVTAEQAPAPPRRGLFRRPLLLLTIVILLTGGVVVGLLWWMDARQYESTDDAFIQADVTQVSPRVAGQVKDVRISDNQLIQAGTTAVLIDPRDFEVKVSEAQAALDASQKQVVQAQENATTQQAQVGQNKAAEEGTQTEANRARDELNRYEHLSPEAVTQQQLINLRAAANSADANLRAAHEKTIWAQAGLKASYAQVDVAKALVQQSQANLDAARLQLSYTDIKAPITGHVTNRSVQVGDYVQVGQALFALVPQEVYVIANFKETQLDLMKPGQDVTIKVDAYPGRVLHGKVDSIQRGSGAAFSLLPPENATGNYVKVVQRVPVKITFTVPDDLVLGPGMSVAPKVKVR
jgi:membrane fusion protein (multidrug efflux system)